MSRVSLALLDAQVEKFECAMTAHIAECAICGRERQLMRAMEEDTGSCLYTALWCPAMEQIRAVAHAADEAMHRLWNAS